MAIPARKAEHLSIAAGPGVDHRSGTGLDDVRLRHRALPGRDLADVSLTTELLGATLGAPLVVSAMTGGTDAATAVNDELARAAAAHGVAMVLGSGRALLDDPSLLRTYRGTSRPPLLLANLGVVGLSADAAARLVSLLDADGLSVHLNAVQEAVQPEGEAGFGGAVERIAAVVEALAPLPVLVKEVGFGMSAHDVIEGLRDPRAGSVAAAFADWGVPTAAAVTAAVGAAPGLPVLASGGLRDGVDVAKCLALGATAGGLARPLLVAAQAGRATDALAVVVDQLRIAVWATGAPSAGALDRDAIA